MALNLMITWFRIDTTVRAVLSVASLALHVVYTIILFWYTMTKMEPASGLAKLLLGSLIITLLLMGELIYSISIIKQESIGVPRVLQVVHQTVSKMVMIRAFVKVGYISLNGQLIKSTTEPTVEQFSNHVDESEPSTKDTATIEHVDSDEEEVDPAKLKWNVFVQPFDRIIFCGIATAYVLMLLVLFLA